MKNYFCSDWQSQLLLIHIVLLTILMSCQQTNNEKEGAEEHVKTKSFQPPNIIIIYNDDLGYGDLSCFGAEKIKTPYIDKLAREGKKLTNFYVASPVCSPSRAALLTGSYPLRVGIPHVLAPHGISWAAKRWRHGLHHDEETLPEMLKAKGYTTGIFGKWHLGHMPEHLPNKHGFDQFYGIPYSNDMRPETNEAYPPLPIIENDKIVEENPDQTTFTGRFTSKAIDFIETNITNPFFVYLANPMPHVPLYASKEFEGKSANGLYGDVIEEIDANVGKIVSFLESKDLRENTIIIFTSDNGPWLSYGNHAGSAGILSEGKFTTMEGGQRVPFIISWPNKIPFGESDALVTNMDIMPTLLKWAGANQPSKQIDGIAMNDFFEGNSKVSGRDELLYYAGEQLQAMRKGNWKIHKPHTYQKIGKNVGKGGKNGKYDKGEIGWALFDLSTDPSEVNDLSAENPELMESLKIRMIEADSLLRLEIRQPFIYEGDAPKIGQLGQLWNEE